MSRTYASLLSLSMFVALGCFIGGIVVGQTMHAPSRPTVPSDLTLAEWESMNVPARYAFCESIVPRQHRWADPERVERIASFYYDLLEIERLSMMQNNVPISTKTDKVRQPLITLSEAVDWQDRDSPAASGSPN